MNLRFLLSITPEAAEVAPGALHVIRWNIEVRNVVRHARIVARPASTVLRCFAIEY